MSRRSLMAFRGPGLPPAFQERSPARALRMFCCGTLALARAAQLAKSSPAASQTRRVDPRENKLKPVVQLPQRCTLRL